MSTSSRWRTTATWILLLGAIAQLARILSIGGKNDSTPFFSANDRSRWCTVASLVEDGGYEIDRIIELRDDTKTPPWRTIDMVRHVGRDGKLHYYSSKPPLLSTIYAGVYWGIYHGLGIRLTEHPFYAGRILLVIVNLFPLVLFWCWCVRWIEEELRGAWAREIALVFLVFGTFLTTFASTLSNHLPGALAVAVSILAWRAIERKWNESAKALAWKSLVLTGAASAFAATCDLPAFSWLGMLGLLLLARFGLRSLPWFAIGALPVLIAFLGTNYLANGEWSPAYAHRGLGSRIGALEVPIEVASLKNADASLEKDFAWKETMLKASIAVLQKDQRDVEGLDQFRPAARLDCWELTNQSGDRRFAVASSPTAKLRVRENVDEPTSSAGELNQSESRSAADAAWAVYEWDDWYDYPGSYWLAGKQKGVDQGEPRIPIYVFHALIGHHGVLSLTPFWILALIGLAIQAKRGGNESLWAAGIISVTLVCFAFYMSRPQIDRNYGGVSSCFRWAIWMIPLWIGPALTGIEKVRSSLMGRRIALTLLALSLFSALSPWTNPWVHPWIYRWMEYMRWL